MNYYNCCPPVLVEAMPLPGDILNLRGISQKQILEHWDLYIGYVNKTNEIREKLVEPDLSDLSATYSPFRCLKVAQTYATNGYKLHELYFSNLGGPGGKPSGRLLAAIHHDFCSYESWEEKFKATGQVMRGWTILAFDYNDGHLYIYGLDGHDLGMVARVEPLLVMDVYEHAYWLQFGKDKTAYINAFFKNIKWDLVSWRLERALAAYKILYSPKSGMY